ncbi:hypothetical protein BpHYR1_035131 [Brachionus plicatilis]|uniref:Uncharacterized protein n=1 Tax=Brachionus plicatilis TaxID=10195 RepID=A0A3M7QM09_BRAPC|nr:hypothetical protein BpHYR1_035131 [Brachionus plicatilis]
MRIDLSKWNIAGQIFSHLLQPVFVGPQRRKVAYQSANFVLSHKFRHLIFGQADQQMKLYVEISELFLDFF